MTTLAVPFLLAVGGLLALQAAANVQLAGSMRSPLGGAACSSRSAPPSSSGSPCCSARSARSSGWARSPRGISPAASAPRST